jgi:CO/xanthine dehydrogenase Mo-binding subunit
MVHAFYSGRWVSAEFQVGATRERWELDGLSVMRPGSSGYAFVSRTDTDPPPDNSYRYGRSQYAPSASVIAVDVDPTSGSVRVTDVHSYLDAGRVLQPGLLSGQYQGGVAMGIGLALLENFPQAGGEGEWNLNRYHVPLAKDVPLDRIELELLPPTDPDAPAKGIAEAVLCPIAPAIANAVSHATGARFRNLPITPAQVRAVLR